MAWEAELPTAAPAVGSPGHAADHAKIVACIVELRTAIDELGAAVEAAAKTATWGQVSNRPSTFAPAAHDHPVEADVDAGLPASPTLSAAFSELSTRVEALGGGGGV